MYLAELDVIEGTTLPTVIVQRATGLKKKKKNICIRDTIYTLSRYLDIFDQATSCLIIPNVGYYVLHTGRFPFNMCRHALHGFAAGKYRATWLLGYVHSI